MQPAAEGSPLTIVLGRLSRGHSLKKLASGYMAHCPAHDDRTASLSVTLSADGKVLLHCHAGCRVEDILPHLGLTLSDLFDRPTTSANSHDPIIYDYRDADGVLRYQVCRFPPKEFRQRRPDGSGGWIWKMAGVKRLPYRLPDLVGHALVYIVEGEADAETLWRLGLPATTNAGGAGKWGTRETKALVEAGVARVVLLPDQDPPGLHHAEMVARSVKAAGLAASLVLLPGLAQHGDVTDWMRLGHTRAELEGLVAAMPYLVPPSGIVGSPATPTTAEVVPACARYALTDLGAAEALRDRYGDRLRYDHHRQAWLVWDGQRWLPDADDAARRLGHEHVRTWQREAAALTTHPSRRALCEFTLRREQHGPLTAMFHEARSLLPIAVSGQTWDLDPWLLGAPNGVVDLKTGVCRIGNPTDQITQQINIPYDPMTLCPRWTQFLREVLEHNEIIDYVHRAVGYTLTGDMREQCFFLCVGSGSNGKSLFLDTLESVWGTYGYRANMRVFVAGAAMNDHDERFQFVNFRGRRLLLASETRPGGRLNEHTLKHFTGGETMSLERKYQDEITFRPVGKIWLAVNHEPKVLDDSYGFWRRVRLIPFPRVFSGSADDRTLRDQLRAERAGILAWAVQGCLAWQQRGLDPPASILTATDAYQQREDPLIDFFAQRTMPAPSGRVSAVALYAAYREWAELNGLSERQRLTANAFGRLVGHRYAAVRTMASRGYLGIVLKRQDLFEQDEAEFDSGGMT